MIRRLPIILVICAALAPPAPARAQADEIVLLPYPDRIQALKAPDHALPPQGRGAGG